MHTGKIAIVFALVFSFATAVGAYAYLDAKTSMPQSQPLAKAK